MKTPLFVVICACAAVALSGCSVRMAYPPVYSDASFAYGQGTVIEVYNPSPYDQVISIEHAIYGYQVGEPFELSSGRMSHSFVLPQGKYIFHVEAIDTGKSIHPKQVIPAYGHIVIKTGM